MRHHVGLNKCIDWSRCYILTLVILLGYKFLWLDNSKLCWYPALPHFHRDTRSKSFITILAYAFTFGFVLISALGGLLSWCSFPFIKMVHTKGKQSAFTLSY